MPLTHLTGSRVRALVVLALVACAALVTCQLLGVAIGAIISKLVASTAFLAVAIHSGAARSRYGRTVFLGLICAWCGDMFLLGDSQGLFLAGLVSFLLGHVAYVAAFWRHGQSYRWSLSALLPVAAISFLVSAWLAPFLPPDMVIPVRVYTFIISLMVMTAFGARGAGSTALIPAGAALFYLSDLSVATMQFTEPEFPTYIWGLPFYYTGQLMLALSVASANRKE